MSLAEITCYIMDSENKGTLGDDSDLILSNWKLTHWLLFLRDIYINFGFIHFCFRARSL